MRAPRQAALGLRRRSSCGSGDCTGGRAGDTRAAIAIAIAIARQRRLARGTAAGSPPPRRLPPAGPPTAAHRRAGPGLGCRRESRAGCRGPPRSGPGCARPMAPPPPPLLLLLLLSVLLGPGAPEPGAGRALSPSSAPGTGSRAVSCLAAAPSLAWYLDGERQETGDQDGATSRENSGGARGTARRLDRRLNCSAVDPATGHASGASVLLRVHFEAEAVQVEARAEDGAAGAPGLLLVLLVSVQARPPADITWVDQDGRLLVNASHFLIVDAKTYPWLGNHSVEVQLRSLARNLSAGASLPLPARGMAAEEEEALSEPENGLALANRGLSQFPMVGYIYRTSSVSSEEIWL